MGFNKVHNQTEETTSLLEQLSTKEIRKLTNRDLNKSIEQLWFEHASSADSGQALAHMLAEKSYRASKHLGIVSIFISTFALIVAVFAQLS